MTITTKKNTTMSLNEGDRVEFVFGEGLKGKRGTFLRKLDTHVIIQVDGAGPSFEGQVIVDRAQAKLIELDPLIRIGISAAEVTDIKEIIDLMMENLQEMRQRMNDITRKME